VNAVLAYVHDSDLRLSDRMRGWRPPRWFRVCMVCATRLGDGWLWIAIAAALAAGGGPHMRALAAGALAAGVASTLLVVLKRRFRRQRPCELAPHPLFGQIRPPDRYSFPSGHTMNAFAIATVLGLQYPALMPALALIAAAIAASRLVIGLHFASDVLAGALLGLPIGLICFLALLG
jgi:undecaprenyl-diphosphatase